MEYLAILLVFFLLNVVILVLGLKKKRIMLLFLSLWFIVGLLDCHFLRFLLFKYTLSRQKHGKLATNLRNKRGCFSHYTRRIGHIC